MNSDVITIEARPQPLTLALLEAAVIVNDMQNDFCIKGGLFDRAGIDITGIRATIPATARVIATARAAGVPIVYIQAGVLPNLANLFQPGSPLRERFVAYGFGQPVRHSDGREGRIGIVDTWNTEIIDELKPQAGDTVVHKHAYSAFHETELDAVLKGLGVKYLIVTGCTTSICVETAIREAHARDYRCVLLEDCTAEPFGQGASGYIGAGGTTAGISNYQATLSLIQALFGWVSNSEVVIDALSVKREAVAQ